MIVSVVRTVTVHEGRMHTRGVLTIGFSTSTADPGMSAEDDSQAQDTYVPDCANSTH